MPERSGAPPAGPVLVLASGDDCACVAALLEADAIPFRTFATMDGLCAALDDAAGTLIVADEALEGADLAALSARLLAQATWSDLPVIVLTLGDVAARRAVVELHVPEALGNVLFIDRPLHAISLVSLVRTALRARRRQRQVRDSMAERAAAARTMAELNDSLERRVAERTEALRTSEAALAQAQKMEAVGRLTGGIAHDFNNLLTAVIGSLELIERRLPASDPQTARLLDAAFRATARGAKLTSQLLAFSRTQKLDLLPVEINAAVAGMDELLARTAGPLVRLRLHTAPEPCIAIADLNQVELAILNLAINARDAMPEGGTLTVSVGREEVPPPATPPSAAAAPADAAPHGPFIAITVSDTGTGMSPEVLSRALEPFFTTKEAGRGTGLGLAQVYGITRQSGGDVRIRSTLGQGTDVTILLPQAPATAAPVTSRQNANPARTAAAADAPKGGVLVVDDDADVRTTYLAALDDLGYATRAAEDGPAALAAISAAPALDAVILDFAMPGMNGAMLAREIRKRWPDLPVIISTGYAEAATLEDIADLPVLHKPVRLAQLAEALHKATHPTR